MHKLDLFIKDAVHPWSHVHERLNVLHSGCDALDD